MLNDHFAEDMYTAAIERYEWNKLQGEKLINYNRAFYKHLKVFFVLSPMFHLE